MGWKRIQRDLTKQSLHGIMKKAGAHRNRKKYTRKQKHKESHVD